MRQRSAAFITLFALAATVAIAQQPPVFTPFGALPVLDNYLEALRKQTGIPGMSAAVVRDGSVIWEKGYGYQNTASKIPATPGERLTSLVFRFISGISRRDLPKRSSRPLWANTRSVGPLILV